MSLDIQTHGFPLALMAVLAVLGVASLGLLYSRKRELQDTVEAQFRGFREQATTLMDQLDALRRRHKDLPSTDADFTTPMSGATLTLYNTVEADLNGLWERWLKIMELWNRAQKLIRSGSGLAVRQAEEARELLNRGDIDELLHRSGSCKERLDRLNRGHEDARGALAAGRAELAALRKTIDLGTGGDLPSDGHNEEIARADTMFVRAEGMIATDPIGAAEVIARARKALTSLARRPGEEPDPRRWPRQTYSPLDDLAAAVDRFRTAAAKLRLTNLLGLFARFWLAVWGVGLLIGLVGPLMPLIIIGLGFVLILAGFWAIWQTVTFWFWYGMWHARR